MHTSVVCKNRNPYFTVTFYILAIVYSLSPNYILDFLNAREQDSLFQTDVIIAQKRFGHIFAFPPSPPAKPQREVIAPPHRQTRSPRRRTDPFTAAHGKRTTLYIPAHTQLSAPHSMRRRGEANL